MAKVILSVLQTLVGAVVVMAGGVVVMVVMFQPTIMAEGMLAEKSWLVLGLLGIVVSTIAAITAAAVSTRREERRREAEELEQLQKHEQERLKAEWKRTRAEGERKWAEEKRRRNAEELARLQEARRREQAIQLRAEECIRELAEIVRTAFFVENCPRCYENEMALISISPTAKSIEYACTHCGKKLRAVASGPDARKVKRLEVSIVGVLGKAWFKTAMGHYRCTFSAPEATLPYEQTTREPITEVIRAEVWRRDNGRCVQCRSREKLQFDHIIPVSKGGATTVANLQLLCQSCNLSKGARI